MLASVRAFLAQEVVPNANRMDGDSEALRQGIVGLGDNGWLALRRPMRYGGPEWNDAEFRGFQEEVARASGALAFLQTQHQSAVGMIAKSENELLKSRILPFAHDGGETVGVGFSQLRRGGPPMVTAIPDGNGFRVSGHVPWVTGESFFDWFIVGATLPDGRALFGVVKFGDGDGISLSEPMRLAAMEAARTVTADLDGHYIGPEWVVDVKPADWIMRSDQINITLQGFFAVGCAQAGIDVVRAAGKRSNRAFLKEAADALERELNQCRARLQAAQATCEETTHEKLKLRAWAIALAGRCAHAAVAASGGAANSVGHPAQRILRESLVFAVSAQTEGIQRATMDQWVGHFDES